MTSAVSFAHALKQQPLLLPPRVAFGKTLAAFDSSGDKVLFSVRAQQANYPQIVFAKQRAAVFYDELKQTLPQFGFQEDKMAELKKIEIHNSLGQKEFMGAFQRVLQGHLKTLCKISLFSESDYVDIRKTLEKELDAFLKIYYKRKMRQTLAPIRQLMPLKQLILQC